MFDLRQFREQMLGISQYQLARMLHVRQDYVSRLEQRPEDMSVELFLRLCDVVGMKPETILRFHFTKPPRLELSDPYLGLCDDIRRMEDYVAPTRQRLAELAGTAPATDEIALAGQLLKQLDLMLRNFGAKPLVAVAGAPSAGKSRLVNALLGEDLLPIAIAQGTPMPIYIKHRDDRPPWAACDVALYKAVVPEQGPWDIRRFRDRSYCEASLITAGGVELLHAAAFADASGEDAVIAVVYAAAPVLLGCDLVDLPPLGSGASPPFNAIEMVLELADAACFLSPAVQFLSGTDATVLLEVARRLPSTAEPLSGLFVIASKADLLAEPERQALLSRLPQLVAPLAEGMQLSDHAGANPLLARIFLHSSIGGEDEAMDYDAFESALRRLLEEELPVRRHRQLTEAIGQFKENARARFWHLADDRRSRSTTGVVNGLPGVDAAAKLAVVRRGGKQLLRLAAQMEEHDAESLRRFYFEFIATDVLREWIIARSLPKATAHTALLRHIADRFGSELRATVEGSTHIYRDQLGSYLSAVHDVVGEVPGLAGAGRFDLSSIAWDVIRERPLRGALYLEAQGIGIGSAALVGGSIGVGVVLSTALLPASALALGVAIAAGTGTLARWLSTDRWEETLAKRVVNFLADRRALDGYLAVVHRYWGGTRESTEEIVHRLQAVAEERLRRPPEETQSQGERKVSAEQTQRLRDFFVGIPWGAAV